MTNPAYKSEHLSVVLEGKEILRDVSFSLESGSSMAIIGPNGAGKSTLLKCLLRLYKPEAGCIQLFGKDLCRYSRAALARLTGYVPQAGEGTVPFSVENFVLMARYSYLRPFSHFTETDRQIARNAMVQARVEAFSDRMLHTLSGGERQKVYIAAALAQQPRVMLLDEATAFLDYRHQVEIGELTEKLRRETGMSVIAVTHDLNQGVLQYDSVLALKNGMVVFSGTPGELLDTGRLESIYDTPFRFLKEPETQTIFVVPGGRTS